MKITLRNSVEKYGNEAYTVLMVQRDKELVFTTEDGKEIASIVATTMVGSDEKTPCGFFLQFKTAEKHPLEYNIASVMTSSGSLPAPPEPPLPPPLVTYSGATKKETIRV